MATYNITVLSTSSTSNGWRLSGMDKNGAINSNTDNPTITVDWEDRIVLDVETSCSAHPLILYAPDGTNYNAALQNITGDIRYQSLCADDAATHFTNLSFVPGSDVSETTIGSSAAGQWQYRCANHSSMVGNINVSSAPTTAAPTTAAPTTAAPTTAAPTTAAPTTVAPTTIAPPPPVQVNNCFTQFDTIKFKRGYFWEFWLENPVLKAGEPSYTMDACAAYLKIGDGTTKWRQLPCFKLECGAKCEIPTTIPPVPPPPDGKSCNPMLCVIFLDESDGPGYHMLHSIDEDYSVNPPYFKQPNGQRGDTIIFPLPHTNPDGSPATVMDIGLTPAGRYWANIRHSSMTTYASRVFLESGGVRTEMAEGSYAYSTGTLTMLNNQHLLTNASVVVERQATASEIAGKLMAEAFTKMMTAFPDRLIFNCMGGNAWWNVLDQPLYISTYADPKYLSGETQRYFCIPTETNNEWLAVKDQAAASCIDGDGNPIPCLNSCDVATTTELHARCAAYWADKAHLWDTRIHGPDSLREVQGALASYSSGQGWQPIKVCPNPINSDVINRGGMWKAMKEVINTKPQSIQDLFYSSDQMAIFLDNSGSTVIWQVESMRNNLVTEAAADGVKTVQSINNGNEHIYCPFCQVECCESLTSEAQLNAYDDFRALCLRDTTVGSYPSCDSTPEPTTTTTTSTTQPPTFTACLGVIAQQNIRINGTTHSVSYAWNQTTERYTATLYLMGTSTLTLTMRCDSSDTSVEPDGWSTRWTASVATNITNGSASVVRDANQSGRGTNNDIPIWDVTFDAAGISERPSSGPNNYDCVYNLDINLNTNQLRWTEQSTSGEDCVSNEDCTDENDIESLGYIQENGLIKTLRLPCPCSCPSDTDVYHTLIYKDPNGNENCYDPNNSGFNSYNATFIYFKTEGDIKYYVATRYFLEVDQQNSISIPVPIPQLQLIMTCDCSKNGHARWGLTANVLGMGDGTASVTDNIMSLGTDSTPPQWEISFTHVDTQCMDLCCGYELQRDNISQAWKWGVTLDSNMFTTDQENDETLCWDIADNQDKFNLENRFPPSSGIINHSAHANASWISGDTGQKGFLMINCTDCGCGPEPAFDGSFIGRDEDVGCGNRAIIEPTIASNNAMCFGTCVYTWDGSEWHVTFEDCDNGAP